MLPYQWGAMPPCEDVYVLGEDRPGSPVPYYLSPPEVDLWGVTFGVPVFIGTAALFP